MTHRFYDVLGVPRDAPEADIKRAYKRAALKLHPDKNKGGGGGNGADEAATNDADASFKELGEAYAVLKDPQARAEYDALGDEAFAARKNGGGPPTGPTAPFPFPFADFFGPGSFNRGGGAGRAPRRMSDTVHPLRIELVDAFRGVSKVLRASVLRRCGCVRSCVACQGAGVVREMMMMPGNICLANTRPCGACGTTGKSGAEPNCGACGGKGATQENRVINVDLPPGVRSGHAIRVSGMGQQPDAPEDTPGDLVIEVTVAAHPTFLRIEDDLQVDVSVTLAEALLGKQLRIDRFGETIELDTVRELGVLQPKKCYALHGKGMPRTSGHGTGDMRLRFDVVWPSTDIRIAPDAAKGLAAALAAAGLMGDI